VVLDTAEGGGAVAELRLPLPGRTAEG
jgi:hypothetical protein